MQGAPDTLPIPPRYVEPWVSMHTLPHVIYLSAGLLQPVTFEEGPSPEIKLVYQPSAPLAANIMEHLYLRSYFGIQTSDFGLHHEYVFPDALELEAGLTLYWTISQ